MDAATYAAASGSLQNFGGEMHLYPQPVYEERPAAATPITAKRRSHDALSSTVDSVESNATEEDQSDTEQALIEKLKSTSITPNSSLPRRFGLKVNFETF